MHFVLTSDALDEFLSNENPISRISELMVSSFQKFSFQIKNLLETAKCLLLEIQNSLTDEDCLKLKNDDYRTRSVTLRNQISKHSLNENNLAINPKNKKLKESDVDLTNLKTLKEKVKSLKLIHQKASKSSDFVGLSFPVIKYQNRSQTLLFK